MRLIKLTLWIKETSHPKGFWSAFIHPAVKLLVSLNKLSEPKAQSGRLPGYVSPEAWDPGIKNVVQGITEVLGQKLQLSSFIKI